MNRTMKNLKEEILRIIIGMFAIQIMKIQIQIIILYMNLKKLLNWVREQKKLFNEYNFEKIINKKISNYWYNLFLFFFTLFMYQ